MVRNVTLWTGPICWLRVVNHEKMEDGERHLENRIPSGRLEWAVPPAAPGWGGRAWLGTLDRGGEGALGLQLPSGVPETSPPLPE